MGRAQFAGLHRLNTGEWLDWLKKPQYSILSATNTMLNEFVDKILVHERGSKGCQDTTQTVEIYFNFVGRYIPPSFRDVELTPEEQEEFRKREERRDKLHQAYLRRKASGKQQEYERRYNAKRKPVMDAKRAALRAEDMERGILHHRRRQLTPSGAAVIIASCI